MPNAPSLFNDVRVVELWRAAGTIVGFQIIFFGWRVARELRIVEEWNKVCLKPSEHGSFPINPTIHFPIADYLNLLSILISIFAIFLVPIATNSIPAWTLVLYGTGLILFASYPFALVGHYEVFRPTKRRAAPKYWPFQEKMAEGITILLILVFVGYVCHFHRQLAARELDRSEINYPR